MKNVPFHFRILMMMITIVGSLALPDDVMGQAIVDGGCSSSGTASTSCSAAIGSNATATGGNSVAIGINSIAGTTSNSNAFAIGQNSYAQGSGSYTFGCKVTCASSSSNNMVIGTGGVINFSNSIDNSIMIGTRMSGSVPTLYVADGAADGGTWGRLGVGTTDPDGLLHLKDESGEDTYMFIEKGTDDEGGVIWHSGAMGPTGVSAELVLEVNETLRLRNATNNQNVVINVNDGNTDKEVIFVEGSSAEVGIGTSSPAAKLHVMAEEDLTGSAIIGRWGIQGIAAPMFLQVANLATTSGAFAPVFQGTSNVSDMEGFFFRGMILDETLDTGTDPVMRFGVRRNNTNDNVLVKTRPLFQFTNNNDPIMTIIPVSSGADANVGIGTITPSYKLDVQGSGTTVFINTNGNMQANGTLYTSDAMFKNQVGDIDNALALIDQFVPRTYYYDTLNFNGVGKFTFGSEKQYGFIAQEVEQVFPELVHHSVKPAFTDSLGNLILDSYQYRSLNYTALIPILTKGVQELRSENLEIKADVVELQEQIEQLTLSNSELRDQVQQLIMAVSACCDQSSASFRLDEESAGISSENKQTNVVLSDSKFVVLEQNVPNPFAERTKINYVVPRESTAAAIVFHDSIGQLIQSVAVKSGSGSIDVFASDLSSGTYTYTLVVDGKVVESKKMTKTD